MSDLKNLIIKSDSMARSIAAMAEDKRLLDRQIAELTCPFKAGDTISTADGLGAKNGLRVSEIAPPDTPRDGNRWVMRCFALTKDGKVSARAVNLEEWQQDFDKPKLAGK